MKRIMFLMTHLGSGWEQYAETLTADVNIDLVKVDPASNPFMIHHLDQLHWITDVPHKKDNSESIWLYPVFHNMQMTRQTFVSLLGHHRFAFYAGSPADSIDKIVKTHRYTPANAAAYYSYRLQGMYLYWKRTNAPWVTAKAAGRAHSRSVSESGRRFGI
jgi:hypothetical protein